MKSLQSVNRAQLQNRLFQCVDQARPIILDSVEQALGDSPSWKFVRGRLLKALGESGMLGQFQEILDDECKTLGGEK
jgi:hypothetical protein